MCRCICEKTLNAQAYDDRRLGRYYVCMSESDQTLAYGEHEALLAEATFFCDTVQDVRLLGTWMPVADVGIADKVYAVTAGRGTLYLEEGRYDLRAGQVMIIPAGTMQQGFSDPEAPLVKYFVHFRSVTAMAVHLLRFYPPPRRLTGPTAKQVTSLCQQMQEEWQGKQRGRQLALRSILMQIMLMAYRADAKDVLPADTSEGVAGKGHCPTEEQYDALRRALACITTRYHEPLVLADIADTAKLSPPYFNTLFSRLVGVPPIRFLESLRMRKARELLASGEMPVAQIAATVGYADANYFSRAFRRRVGVSPSIYRVSSRQ